MEYISFEHNNIAAELVKQAYDTPPLAFVHSYGCQQNVNDGERIKGVLMDIGYGLCDKPEDADLILFNTCAVREHAEQRVFGNVGALKGLKEKKHDLIIGLCGCMANQKHVVEKLRKSYPYVDLVFGVDGIDTLPQLIAQKLQKHKRVLMEPAQRPVIVENIPIRRESEFRAWLPIMYGCDNFCTYCIVPYVRGREKSRKPGDILAEFRGLVEAGYKEITLLGQNVNSYGKGLEEKVDFSDLLNLLCTVPGDYHIRFMTSHPKDASHKLIDTIAAQPKLCKHLHLPVQCGSDELLKKMNRHYTVEQYMELIEYARKTVPGITFSSDIIVGFPGETEEDFEELCKFIKEAKFERFGAFTQVWSGHGDLLQHVGETFASAYEIAAGQIGAVQHTRQAFALSPFVDDIGDAEIKLARLVEGIVLTQHGNRRVHAFELRRTDGDVPLHSSGIMARLSPAASAWLVNQRHDGAGQLRRIESVERAIIDRLGKHQIKLAVQVPQQLSTFGKPVIDMFFCAFIKPIEVSELVQHIADAVELTCHGAGA